MRNGSNVKVKNLLLSAAGFVLLGVGAVGVALPVLPTTPFVLLAAICFSAGNSKISGWLQRSRIFGPYIENYRNKQGISKALKISSIIFVWKGLAVSIIITQKLWLSILLTAIGTGVTIHLLCIKTKG